MPRIGSWGWAGSLALVALAAAACKDAPATSRAAGKEGAVEPGGVAVLAEGSDINLPLSIIANSELDANLTGDVMNMQLLHGAWENGGLVYLTADRSPLSLARSYEYLPPDSTALRFHMRSDVKWSDGQPVTAHDVEFTYRWVADPALASNYQSYVEHMDSVVAQDDSTVTLYFDRRYPLMIFHSTVTPLPKHVYQNVRAADLRGHPSVLHPENGGMVVSGPFMIGEHRQGERLVLVRNPYFRPRANLDQIVIRFITEPTTRLVELQTGNIDFARTVSFDQLPALKADPNLRLEKEDMRGFDFVAYNPLKFAAFADPEIRRALGMALNTPRMIQALQMSDYAKPSSSPYSPIFTELYDPAVTPPLPYDPEGAKRILDAKGWRDSDGDGIRDKDGKPFRFSLVTNASNQRRIDAAQIVQQAWRAIGVDAQFHSAEFNTMYDNLRKKQFQAVLGGYVGGFNPDLTPLFGKNSPQNATSYANPRVWALFDSAFAQPSAPAAAVYWKKAAAIISHDQPYTWLYYVDAVDVLRDRLKNTDIDTWGPYNNTWEWWIPASQRRPGATSATPKDSATR